MKGWLLFNSSNHAPGLRETASLLTSAFQVHDIDLEPITNDRILCYFDESGAAKFDLLCSSFWPDFVLAWDKDIRLFRHLELSGIRVFNSYDSIWACDDKFATFQKLANEGIPMPITIQKNMDYSSEEKENSSFLTAVTGRLGLPLVLKQNFGSLGNQVHLVRDCNALRQLVESLKPSSIIFQELCANSIGRDIRVCVVGGVVTAAVARQSQDSFKVDVARVSPIRLNSAQSRLATKCCKLLNLDFGAVDMLYGRNGGNIICEVNSSPYLHNLPTEMHRQTARAIAHYIKACLD